MIEAPTVGAVEFALQAVDFRAQAGIVGLFGQLLGGLVVFPEQVGFRPETAGHQIENRAFHPDGNLLVKLGHPKIGQAFALPFVGFDLSGQDAQKGGLALSVATEQANALLLVDGDAGVV